MIVEWRNLLTENSIPQHQWPQQVEEVSTQDAVKNSVPPITTIVVTYPEGQPVTVHNADLGRNEWNPEIRDALGVIYTAYKNHYGRLSAPTWSRAGNAVRFSPV